MSEVAEAVKSAVLGSTGGQGGAQSTAGVMQASQGAVAGARINVARAGDIPDLGADENGRYGDDEIGTSGAARDYAKDLPLNPLTLSGMVSAQARINVLRRIDAGLLPTDPESRLGAYDATKGYPPGTVGDSVHNAIGTIYATLGNYGQEKIGRVFNSPEVRELYAEPVESDAGKRMAAIEKQYWENVRREDPNSPGGQLGSMFSADGRYKLQRLFGNVVPIFRAPK